MHKKLIGTAALVVALVSLAGLPSLAAAAPAVREGGLALVAGTKIQATNAGNITFTATGPKSEDLGTMTCTVSTMNASLVTNDPFKNGIEANLETISFTGTEAGAKCASSIGGNQPFMVDVENLAYCLTSKTFGSFSIRGGKCTEGTKNLKFTTTGSTLNCTYEAASISGTYKAEDPTGSPTEATKLSIAGQTFNLTKGALCPTSGHLTVTYFLERSGTTTALTIG